MLHGVIWQGAVKRCDVRRVVRGKRREISKRGSLNTAEIGYDKWYIRKLQEKGRKVAGKRHFLATQLFLMLRAGTEPDVT